MNKDSTEVSKPSTPQPKTWWKRKEFWSGVGYVASTGAMLFAPEHTVLYKAGYLVSTALAVFGLTKGYQAKNLKPTKDNYKIK